VAIDDCAAGLRAMLPHLHLLHRLPRERGEQFGSGDVERLGQPDDDRQARHLQAEFQIADVVAGEVGGFGEGFLGEVARLAELAEAAAEKLRFLHRCIPHCRWNKVLQLALEGSFS
jgi:hypothetical protein